MLAGRDPEGGTTASNGRNVLQRCGFIAPRQLCCELCDAVNPGTHGAGVSNESVYGVVVLGLSRVDAVMKGDEGNELAALSSRETRESCGHASEPTHDLHVCWGTLTESSVAVTSCMRVKEAWGGCPP